MHKKFIWQFKFKIQGQLFHQKWHEKVINDDNINYEQRFFWRGDEDVILTGLTEQQLWLSSYDFERHNDCYLLLNDNRNIKFRHKKLHYKPLLNQVNNVCGFAVKKKFKLSKNQDDINKLLQINSLFSYQTKEEVKELLRSEFKTCDVYKEALTLKLNQFNNTSIELSKIKVNEEIYFSVVIEAFSLVLVNKIVAALGIKKNSQDYVSFLKEHQC